jgi:dTDP-4-dehydrorhamnose 3,5-epimerase-like enzyme
MPAEPRLLRLPTFSDARGSLAVADGGELLPFPAARYFVISEVPPGQRRAGHAQLRGHELFCCLAGACTVEVRWAERREVHRLESPETSLHVPPGVWVECREFSPDAALLVLCSHPYDPAEQVGETR